MQTDIYESMNVLKLTIMSQVHKNSVQHCFFPSPQWEFSAILIVLITKTLISLQKRIFTGRISHRLVDNGNV